MVKIKKLVLDVLKPQEPTIIEFAKTIKGIPGVEDVNIVTKKVDRKIENIQITIMGSGMDASEIMSTIEKMGGGIESVTEVEAGKCSLNDR